MFLITIQVKQKAMAEVPAALFLPLQGEGVSLKRRFFGA
jgi:hypothetical protein